MPARVARVTARAPRCARLEVALCVCLLRLGSARPKRNRSTPDDSSARRRCRSSSSSRHASVVVAVTRAFVRRPVAHPPPPNWSIDSTAETLGSLIGDQLQLSNSKTENLDLIRGLTIFLLPEITLSHLRNNTSTGETDGAHLASQLRPMSVRKNRYWGSGERAQTHQTRSGQLERVSERKHLVRFIRYTRLRRRPRSFNYHQLKHQSIRGARAVDGRTLRGHATVANEGLRCMLDRCILNVWKLLFGGRSRAPTRCSAAKSKELYDFCE